MQEEMGKLVFCTLRLLPWGNGRYFVIPLRLEAWADILSFLKNTMVTAIFKMYNQQGPTTVYHMELCSTLCGSLHARGVWGKMDTCVHMAESLCCSSEATTALLSGYNPIQNKKLITTKHCGQFLDCFHVHNQEIIYIKVHSLSNFGQSEKEMVIVVQ